MARPIWTGTLSFGLLNVPIRLMTAERKVDLHFRMLDQRNNQPVRYERVNAESGEEVPWKDIVKAYEYSKGNYVVLEESDIRSAAAEAHETVEIDTFIDAGQLTPAYFEKPYFLVPGKKAEKGYVLLREVLKRTGKVGIARVVIRTREYLCAVMPQDEALMLILLRFPQELVDAEEYALPDKAVSEYRISDRELEMAGELIESMSGKFEPERKKSPRTPTPPPTWWTSWRCSRRASRASSARRPGARTRRKRRKRNRRRRPPPRRPRRRRRRLRARVRRRRRRLRARVARPDEA
jgi:DNA end-binding protein Ku